MSIHKEMKKITWIFSKKAILIIGGTYLVTCVHFSIANEQGTVHLQNKDSSGWIKSEFQPSTLSVEEQIEEIKWFVSASLPLRGLKIDVASEDMRVNQYESMILAKAFRELTGISVTHHIMEKDQLLEVLQLQLKLNRSLYDGYILPADIMGTLFRYDRLIPIDYFLEEERASVLLPSIDINDLMGLAFMKSPENKLYQLPVHQYAILYWFRQDWFSREDLRLKFKEIFGYELGIPLNWSAYDDIANFFTLHVKEIDGKTVYGHMDYARNDSRLFNRLTEGWMALAGVGDRGVPYGVPVDEWGIRSENCHANGSSIQKGGEVNGPSSLYALNTYIQWVQKYAPPESSVMTERQALEFEVRGHVAQQINWNTSNLDEIDKDLYPLINENGSSKWKVAPPPVGVYHQKGMRRGYRGVNGWTFFKETEERKLNAAWLYAQFTVCRTVSLKKTFYGIIPIRFSDLFSDNLKEHSDKYGGIIELFRSPLINHFSPHGFNVSEYFKLSSVWWRNISSALKGDSTPQSALDAIAEKQDHILLKLSKSDELLICRPKLKKTPTFISFFTKYGSSKKKNENETVTPLTVSYDAIVKMMNGKDLFSDGPGPDPVFDMSDF